MSVGKWLGYGLRSPFCNQRRWRYIQKQVGAGVVSTIISYVFKYRITRFS